MEVLFVVSLFVSLVVGIGAGFYLSLVSMIFITFFSALFARIVYKISNNSSSDLEPIESEVSYAIYTCLGTLVLTMWINSAFSSGLAERIFTNPALFK